MKSFSFTLVEILIVIAILGALTGLAFPLMRSIWLSSRIHEASREIIQSLKEAQSRAIDGRLDSKWGVSFDIDNNNFTFFKGPSFSERDPTYDIETRLPDSVEIKNINLNGGGTEIIFEKTSGKTNQYGSLTLLSSDLQTKNIIINEYGVIKSD